MTKHFKPKIAVDLQIIILPYISLWQFVVIVQSVILRLQMVCNKSIVTVRIQIRIQKGFFLNFGSGVRTFKSPFRMSIRIQNASLLFRDIKKFQ